MNGYLCPQIEFAPQTPVEMRAWRASQGDGVWDFDWIEKEESGQRLSRRKPLGMKVGEALARCPPADADEREALVELFTAIEQGAVTGACKGVESIEDRREEEGG